MKKVLHLSATAIAAAVAALAATLIMASPAAANDREFYVQYNGGVTFVPHQSLENNGSTGISLINGQPLDGRTDQNPGFNVGGAIGARFLEHFRGELEYMYRENEVTDFSLQSQPSSADGSVGVMTVMANFYAEYDFEIGIVPYVGVGIGWGQVALDAKNREFPELSQFDSKESVFAYNFLIGGSIPVNEVVDISLGYRYLRTTDSKPNNSLSNPNVTPTQRRSVRMKYEYDAHEGYVGVRFNF